MYEDGRVVLDIDNNPVMDFPDIPPPLPSEVEPALMEAIRRIDPRIRWEDAHWMEHGVCYGCSLLYFNMR